MSVPTLDERSVVAALKDACELEHQLMLEYLYAGFSLKRDPDATCKPAQYEAVRRWSSTLFMIARQEMEHLSLANGMLTALGAPVHFGRPNIGPEGLLSPYLASSTLARGLDAGDPTPISLPYSFDPFSIATVKRFVCGESPPYSAFKPPADAPAWCFTCAGVEAAAAAPPAAPLATPWLGAADDQQGVGAGTVQELYDAIREAFLRLPDLFVSSPPQVIVPVEYNVFVFPITDQRSAIGAIDVILEQGEGLGDPWNLDSHFRRFREIHDELLAMTAAGTGFEPAYPMLSNPQGEQIVDPLTRAVFDLANQAYATLLLVLAALYQRAVPPGTGAYPYLSDALSQSAFAAAMTMIIRALNEVLVRMPIGDGDMRTGSNFYIDPEDRELVELLANPRDTRLGDIGFLHDRWTKLTDAIGRAAEQAGADPVAAPGLRYVHESAVRIGANLRETYQFGIYSKYVSI